MKKKKLIQLLVLCSLIGSIAGCGSTPVQDVSGSGQIVLLDPVNAASTTEAAAYRNLYDATIYSAYVIPYTEEYSFDKDISFEKYGAFPGETVSTGQSLLYSNTESVDAQIESLTERLSSMKESLDAYELETREQVASLKTSAKELYAASGDTREYRLLCHDVETLENQIRQRKAVYDLDSSYYKKQLESLKSGQKNDSLNSGMDGTVVAMNNYTKGNWIGKDTPVAAVGDLSRKLLRTDYINRATIHKASEIYAIIDGERYELTYQAIDPEEYTRLTAKGETVYSTFEFVGDTTNISIGDFATITLVNNKRENVLCVPNDALHKDENGTYVYAVTSEGSTYTLLHTGMSDGVYTEVLDGLSAGDIVITEGTKKLGEGTATITRGAFSTKFEAKGEAFYPSQKSVVNEIPYGTVYFVSFIADTFQHVEAGDPIATVRVEKDSIDLERSERSLSRLKERLKDLKAEKNDANAFSIERMEDQIAELNEKIREMKDAYETVTICATTSGVITQETAFAPEDIISRGSEIAKIADESSCYVRVENDKQLLNLGNTVNISYQDQEKNSHSTTGTVVTLASRGTSNALAQDTVLIQVPREAVSEMTSALLLPAGFDGGGSSWFDNWRKIFSVTADVRTMDNVMIVPKSAVFELNKRTYVYVKEADGSIVAKSFIAGGFNASNYWIIDGLEEGMEVCLK